MAWFEGFDSCYITLSADKLVGLFISRTHEDFYWLCQRTNTVWFSPRLEWNAFHSTWSFLYYPLYSTISMQTPVLTRTCCLSHVRPTWRLPRPTIISLHGRVQPYVRLKHLFAGAIAPRLTRSMLLLATRVMLICSYTTSTPNTVATSARSFFVANHTWSHPDASLHFFYSCFRYQAAQCVALESAACDTK